MLNNGLTRHLRRLLIPAVLAASFGVPGVAMAHDEDGVPTCAEMYLVSAGHDPADPAETDLIVKIYLGGSDITAPTPAVIGEPAFVPDCADVSFSVDVTPLDGSGSVSHTGTFLEQLGGIETSTSQTNLLGRTYAEFDLPGSEFVGGAAPSGYTIVVRSYQGGQQVDQHQETVVGGSGGGNTYF